MFVFTSQVHEMFVKIITALFVVTVLSIVGVARGECKQDERGVEHIITVSYTCGCSGGQCWFFLMKEQRSV